MNAILLILSLLSGPTITDIGYCSDVTAPSCPVRDFWPRFNRAQSAGTEAYYFVSGFYNNARVAFVPREVYVRFTVSMSAPDGLVWRPRQP